MKIFIDAGHGGTDPGAVNLEFGMTEATMNLDIAIRLERLLIERGYTTRMSRRSDIFVSLQQRANEANSWGADYYVSIHCNASVIPEANGTETLYYSDYSEGMHLAQSIQEHLVAANGLADRGIVPRPNLAVLRLTFMPSVLAEIAFISNPEEAALLATIDFRQACARGIADGISAFLGDRM